jgi:uncharacterized protein YegP (UPF0339 family)
MLGRVTGHHFEIFKLDGLWYWHLEGANFPTGPIAKSGRGYTSKQAALRSINSAKRAAAHASADPLQRDPPREGGGSAHVEACEQVAFESWGPCETPSSADKAALPVTPSSQRAN